MFAEAFLVPGVPSYHRTRPPLQHLPSQYTPCARPEGLALPSYIWARQGSFLSLHFITLLTSSSPATPLLLQFTSLYLSLSFPQMAAPFLCSLVYLWHQHSDNLWYVYRDWGRKRGRRKNSFSTWHWDDENETILFSLMINAWGPLSSETSGDNVT